MSVNKIHETFKLKINRSLLITVFLLFLLILIWAVIFKFVGFNETFASFKGIKGQISVNITKNIYERITHQFDYIFHKQAFLKDIIPNIILFIPFGILLSLLNKNKLVINLIIAASTTIFFEVFELFTGIGGFNFLNIIFNILGFLLGYGIVKLCEFLIKNEEKFNCTVNYCCVISIILGLPFVAYIYSQIIINFEIFMPCFELQNYINLFTFK